ncbi:hypothetical protein F4678DRAFT_472786 [Xylaria arbuscula]|nr:hypothetical protein F4678DRAFT_472786 [Xylaria arbuscula]
MMPLGARRSRLQTDVEAAGSHEVSIPHIQAIGNGDVQDEFVFTFIHPMVPRGEIRIHVMPQDAAGYPREHYFLVYTNEDVSSEIRMVLDNAMTSTRGMVIIDLLKSLSHLLCDKLGSVGSTEEEDDDDQNAVMTDADDDADSSDGLDDSDTDVPFDYGDEDDLGTYDRFHDTGLTSISNAALQRIRQDFRVARNAGFRVGKICGIDHLSEQNIMAMSIKASKLCLSKETHTAWKLSPSDYLVLLIKYSEEHASFEDVMEKPAKQCPLEFRLRRCSRYRPTLAQAIAAFSLPRKGGPGHLTQTSADEKFLSFGIGGSIDLLLESDFIIMMKLRKKFNVSWDDAKKMQAQAQLNMPPIWDNSSSMEVPTGDTSSSSIIDTSLPPIITEDHLSGRGPISLPLVAMQFSLRYLVKCTDYCMICRQKTPGNFEALKPYVCGNPLCLFQYMNLGLGPSIDQEIVDQEYVVDLLISFCYASLYYRSKPQLREFPSGLSLQVPCIQPPYIGSVSINRADNHGTLIDPREVEISWPDNQAKIIPEYRAHHPALALGCWVVIHTYHKDPQDTEWGHPLHIYHFARIEEKIGSTIKLYIASRYPMPMTLSAFENVKRWDWDEIDSTSGQLVLCNQSLDDLKTEEEKAFSLILLLSALPSVREMRSYLMADQHRQLATWDRIPSEAMKLLRWIIASNRSFIVQLDNPSSPGADTTGMEDIILDRSREKVSGIDGWIQFRFAQGSPEKEALFLDALQEVKTEHRTILAWHGSPIGNWHSIIREGLNFNVTAHGRAFGDGVYFSRSFEYSLSYTDRFSANGANEFFWPQSSLKVMSAISLNELVNMPDKFKYNQSCYVLDVLHWIQCRYLFVKPMFDSMIQTGKKRTVSKKGDEFEQDPLRTVTGLQNKKLFVPKIAIPSAQRWQHCDSSSDEASSDNTDDEDDEDMEFLALEVDIDQRTTKARPGMSNDFPSTPKNQELQTDFCPGRLDFSQLPRLPPPSYATGAAQQVLQRELQKLEKIQSQTPLHQLGWYIDFDKIDNMFQWIVELHSFDPSLPLAQDMKTAGFTSIVVEIRFLRGFPLTPPFVRVIKPYFLPFSRGGGGHVTSGGAMCMELLTNTGWSPVNSMESVLLQVRLAMCDLEPRPARLERLDNSASQYSYGAAVDAAVRAFNQHGWEIPVELTESLLG